MIDETLRAHITVIVPAAGKGVRMGGPKQYMLINGVPLLQHTLAPLLQIGAREVVLVVGAGDEQAGHIVLSERCRFVAGGACRADSVLAALHSLDVPRDDWVLVHDGARPCVRLGDIEHLVTVVADHAVGGILATPIVETVKQAKGSEIERTLERKHLWAAQTPQMFRFGLLLDALVNAREQGVEITDEASALELAGYRPLLVRGHADNIKVTSPEDLVLAARILERRATA